MWYVIAQSVQCGSAQRAARLSNVPGDDSVLCVLLKAIRMRQLAQLEQVPAAQCLSFPSLWMPCESASSAWPELR